MSTNTSAGDAHLRDLAFLRQNKREFYYLYQRELVASTLKTRNVCPVCEREGCKLQCTRCKAVYYCSKTCQLKHWPTHKKICRIYDDIFMEALKIESDDKIGHNYYAYIVLSEVFCIRLLVAGIEAEIATCTVRFKSPNLVAERFPCLITVAEGHIYDLSRFFRKNTGQLYKEILPIPLSDDIIEGSRLGEFLESNFPDIMNIPFHIQNKSQICVDDVRQLIMFGCQFYIGQHYISDNFTDNRLKEGVIRLYGKEIADRYTVDQFCRELDRAIPWNKEDDHYDERGFEYYRLQINFWKCRIKPLLKKETLEVAYSGDRGHPLFPTYGERDNWL